MCKRRALVSIIIRWLTAESFNHVAMVIRQHGGVFVVEMREGKGWQMMPMSQWLHVNRNAEVYWGKAPARVRGSYCIEDYALKARGTRYSYMSLLSVWWSQIWKRKTKTRMVCSTFIQAGYDACGVHLVEKTMDPGDFMEYLRDINKITL